MIWHSLTFSRLIPFLLLIPDPQAWLLAGTLTGSVEIIGARSPVVHGKRDYSGVVIWLERLDGTPTPPRPKTVQMIQKNKRFVPHILAIPVGSSVTFPNLDPIFHNAFSSFSGQIFDVGLHSPGTAPKVRFQQPGLVRVFCNIHSNMSAVIAVLPSPYMAISQVGGAFVLDHVAPGFYRLRVFHDRSTEESLKALEVDLNVGEDGLRLPLMRVKESGATQVPHKNKYGLSYPQVVTDRPMYPAGGRR